MGFRDIVCLVFTKDAQQRFRQFWTHSDLCTGSSVEKDDMSMTQTSESEKKTNVV